MPGQPNVSLMPQGEGEERKACRAVDPPGFHIRHQPPPHVLDEFITPDNLLFETIHMGPAVVDEEKWLLLIDGLVQHPFALTLDQLKKFPRTTLTAFHECYGNPLAPPTKAIWRVGNVTWTGVKLQTLLDIAAPLAAGTFVWSEGLDHGTFASVTADRYQKDMPLAKARQPEVLVAYEMNGAPLRKERGGPVRLIVPGWFGTNMTKWLCRIAVQARRAPSPFTTVLYNERDDASTSSGEEAASTRPVWAVEPNSMIVDPPADARLTGTDEGVEVRGWAWSHDGVSSVCVSANDGSSWVEADVSDRVDFSWQRFRVRMALPVGSYHIIARATSRAGVQQPMRGRRNHVHRIRLDVVE